MIQTVILIHGGSFPLIRDAETLAWTQGFCDIGTRRQLKKTEAEIT
ncbi:MAG: hypothetical protein HZA88_16255 [Verrucomicrobia bacterium]|nr:hypothetical protein [Verrucomicrobiota bacterium]